MIRWLQNLRRRVRRTLRNVLRSRQTPHQVAGGFAIGTLIGFTPTMGVQMASAAVLATIFRVNRLAAVAMVYITNPFTAVPIYGFCYWVGALMLRPFGVRTLRWEDMRHLFLAPEDLSEAPDTGLWATVFGKLREAFNLGWRAMAPLWLGCVVMGIIAAILVYFMALRFVTGHRLIHAQRLALRAQKRLHQVRARQERERQHAEKDTEHGRSDPPAASR